MDALLILVAAALAWLFWKGSSASAYVSSGENELDQSWADYEGNQVEGGTNKIAQAIAHMEGFFAQTSTPNIPQRTNNPGDIGTFNGHIASYNSPEEGFTALDDYINKHATEHPDWDFYDFFHYYLTGDPNGAPGPGQNPDGYAEFVASQVGVEPTTLLSTLIG